MKRRSFLKCVAACLAAVPLASVAKPTQSADGSTEVVDHVNTTPTVPYQRPRSIYLEFPEMYADHFNLPRKCIISDVGGLQTVKLGGMHYRTSYFADYIYDIANDKVLKDRYDGAALQVKRDFSNEYVQIMSLQVFNNRIKKG